MENRTTGIFFNEQDVREVVEKHLELAEIAEGQVFCVTNIMNDKTPIGTAIMVGVDGIKCKEGSKELKLSLSSGIYELTVKTISENDAVSLRLTESCPIHGTYGQKVDGKIDILTDEEKAFATCVDKLLGERQDNFAEMFRAVNKREIGGRGLELLERIKTEIKNDLILTENGVTPEDLIGAFVELTGKLVAATDEIGKLQAKFGRARNLGEKSIGTLDPGAVSNAMIFEAFAKAFK